MFSNFISKRLLLRKTKLNAWKELSLDNGYAAPTHPVKSYLKKKYKWFFLKLGFTPRKAEEPLRGMALQEKDKKDEKDIRKL